MTAQMGEILYYKGKIFYLTTEPLQPLLNILGDDIEKIGGEDSSPSEIMMSTACRRGYIGTWEIVEDKLFLKDLKGYPEENKKYTMNNLFPNQKEVFAKWFTGEIKMPQGKMLHYEHLGYCSIFEKDLFLGFKKGELVNKREVDNTKTFDPEDPMGWL
jgi:hypothetical protein